MRAGQRSARTVIQNDADNARTANTIVASITKNTSRAGEPTHLLIELATPEGKQSGLNNTSVVVCNNLFTIDQKKVLKTIGQLPPATMTRIGACLKAALGLP